MKLVTDFTDTIVAQATPPGRGGVGIVRVSGTLVPAIAARLLDKAPTPRYAHYGVFRDGAGDTIDSGLALYFPAPHSYTGEHVLELHAHGGPITLDRLQQRVLELGARPARPGEFSERAFLNGKMDLAQAEAVADLIESGSVQAARAAQRSLAGEFSARINSLVEQLIELRGYVEASIDFSEEELGALSDARVGAALQKIIAELDAVFAGARQGSLLREGLRVVIAGRPNVGKSSLLNRLAGRDAAIVTDVPGTTRDVLRETIQLDGLPLHVIDTAGLRAGGDQIEQEGMRRARHEIAHADHVLLVVDDGAGSGARERAIMEELPSGVPRTVVRNKIDISGHAPGLETTSENLTTVWLSAKSAAGLDVLRAHIKHSAGLHDNTEGVFSARRRHLDALTRARGALENARREVRERRAAELLAEELRQAQNALGEITGVFTTEDLLGRIFSSFCIGK